MANLIPSHYTEREKKLESTGAASIERVMSELWSGRLHDPATCKASFLFALGQYYGVEYWWQNISEDEHRALIAAFPTIKRRRGTLWAVKQAVNVIDAGALIVEGDYQIRFDATATHNGVYQHGNATHWAEYVVIASRPMINAQAAQLKRLTKSVAPARSSLLRIDYTRVAATHSGTIYYDGNYNYGSVS
ncbi:phage tail protein [Sulfurospirillum cavolei]|uniref:phage tail protein n=1 Tax=Sulfurospirillum cavolei TaxID=366522 RepID=UPI000764C528|nr:phage tail protein [Sulfurospirillum cavolei]